MIVDSFGGLVFEQVDGDGVVECLEDAGLVGGQSTDFVAVEGLPFVGQVEVVHGIMEDCAEHGLIDIVRHFILGPQSCHVAEVELQRALHVGVDGGGREDVLGIEPLVQLRHHVGILLHADGLDGLGLAGGGESAQSYLLTFGEELVLLGEGLQHEARHLSLVATICTGIVEQGDALGALQESIIIVGIKAHFAFDGGHAVCRTEGVGDERRAFVALGYLPLVDGEHDDVAEVEVTGLEQSHHLQSDGRLAVEGNGGLAHELTDESGEHFIAHCQSLVGWFEEGVDAVDDGVCHEDALLVDLQGEVLLVESILVAVPDHRDDFRQIRGQFLARCRGEDASQDVVVGKSFRAGEDHIVLGELAQFLVTAFAHQLLDERVFQHRRHIFISPCTRGGATMHLQFHECQHQ